VSETRYENGTPPPQRIVVVDDRLRADDACRMARDGSVLLWRGDYHNARQLLRAMGRRCDRAAPPRSGSYPRQRRARGRRARILGMVVVELGPDYGLALRRAPDVRRACEEAYGPPPGRGRLVALTELLGVIGAHRWRVAGVDVPALGARIHPHYGVFAPTRNEYVDLVARAPLPTREVAFDVGTGTGVLAAVLARLGVARVVATDVSGRAVACARENVARLGLAGRVEVMRADLFPPGRAGLVVCNPPWLPGHAASELERAVYDPGGRMLHGFLGGLAEHLAPGGEGWLILSDLAERLGLRPRGELPAAIDAAGLSVVGTAEVRPRHGRAREGEVTRLWRLGRK
jgi:SAM-dependent methyltransferase